jgi:hypothetical protein
VGSGEGLYLAGDEAEAGNATRVLGLITRAQSYRFSERCSRRLHSYRTITTEGRDSDVVMFGRG